MGTESVLAQRVRRERRPRHGHLRDPIPELQPREALDELRVARALLAEPLDENLEVAGEAFVLADASQAGVGDVVSWVGGREAALALPTHFVPIDAAVVTIVDQVDARSLP